MNGRSRTTAARALATALTLIAPLPGVATAQLPTDSQAHAGIASGDAATPLPRTLTLPAVLERALAVDPTLAAARAAGDAAAHGLEAARAERLPSLTSAANMTRHQKPMVVAPLHGFDPTNPPAFDRTLIQGRLGMEWTLWDGGAIGGEIHRAGATSAAAAAGVASTRQARIVRVAAAYLTVLTARDVLQAMETRTTALDAERERVTRNLAEGSAARVELLRAQAEWSRARAETEAARSRRDAAEARLARMLEMPTDEVVDANLAEPAVPPIAPASPTAPPVDSAFLASHPAVLAARQRAEAARAEAAVARASRFPTLAATGAWHEFGAGSGDFQGEWQAGLRVSWPVFTGGARRAAVAAAGAHARQTAAEVRAVERDVLDAADAALAAAAEARVRALALAEAVEQFEELARVEALALAEGAGTQSDFLRAQAGLAEARAELAEAGRTAVLARLERARALGRLTPELVEAWANDGSTDGGSPDDARPAVLSHLPKEEGR